MDKPFAFIDVLSCSLTNFRNRPVRTLHLFLPPKMNSKLHSTSGKTAQPTVNKEAGVTGRKDKDPHGKNKDRKRSRKNAQISTSVLTDLVSQLQAANDNRQEAKMEQKADIADVMLPYTVGPIGEDLTTNWTITEYTKANLIDDMVFSTDLLEMADIIICKLDYRRVFMANPGMHIMRILEPLAMYLGANFSSLLKHSQILPANHMPQVLQQQAIIQEDLAMQQTHSEVLELRASVRPYESDPLSTGHNSLGFSDSRPTFDRTEKRVIEDIFVLQPYVLLKIDSADGERNPIVFDDPLAFSCKGWETNASAWQKAFSLKVPFRPRYISAQLLAELVNRRTIVAGLDNPTIAISRINDIIERSPCFQEFHKLRLMIGSSVIQDTRDIAVAMVTSQPWLSHTDF